MEEKKVDLRKFNRGHKGVSGRKPKSEELKLIETLTPLQPIALEKLRQGIEKGDFKFIKLFYEYFYGKPKETKDIKITQEQPIFSIDYDDISEDIKEEDIDEL